MGDSRIRVVVLYKRARGKYYVDQWQVTRFVQTVQVEESQVRSLLYVSHALAR